MKNILSIVLVSFLFSTFYCSIAQVPNIHSPSVYQQSNLKYNDVKVQLDSTFQSSTDTTEGSGKEKVEHWKHFWNDRASINFSSGKNAFSGLQELAKLIIDDPNSLCEYADDHQGDWSSIGPDTLASGKQAIGLMNAIWASPTDSNYLLAGSAAGGLWKTTDGGKHWANITDGANLAGTFGVGSIAVNPTDSDEIWVTAPSNSHLQGAEWFSVGYNFGAMHSTDGGSTWNNESYFWNGSWGLGFTVNKFVYGGDGNLYAFGTRDNAQHIYMKPDGQSWTSIQSFIVNSDTVITDIDVLPQTPFTMFASTKGIVQGTNKVALLLAYSATTGALLNTNIYSGLSPNFSFINDMSIPCDTLVYFNCLLPRNGTSYDTIRFVKFNTATNTFTLLSNTLAQFYAIGTMVVSPANRNVIYHGSPQGITYGGDAVLYMSIDAAVTFHPISAYDGVPTHGDIRDLCLHTSSSIDSGKGDLLFFACDGGSARNQ